MRSVELGSAYFVFTCQYINRVTNYTTIVSVQENKEIPNSTLFASQSLYHISYSVVHSMCEN